mgnify:CR=1 FL=1
MSTTWIDFKELREAVRIMDVLKHYNVELRIKGGRATGLCPLPTHPSRDSGKRTPSFSVNLERGLWNCFGCKAGGNVLDLAVRLAGKSPDDPGAVRQVAVELHRLYADRSTGNVSDNNEPGVKPSRAVQATASPSRVTANTVPIVVNAPLDFELKHLDPGHSYLRARGLTSETIRSFGLGYCSRGMLKDRIAIPLHDKRGNRVGYAGRLVSDESVDADHPRYLFPGPRERDGRRFELHKSKLLFNAHRVGRQLASLIVVEGFFATFWLTQNGYPNVVALLGSACSDEQADLICDMTSAGTRIVVLTDGDDAGRQCAGDLFIRLGSERRLRLARLGEGEQPTDLDADSLSGIIQFALD